MKKFAKLLALVMVFAVMIGMGTVAFAAEGEDADNLFANGAITINKTYTLIGEGSSPAETFTITVGAGKIVGGRDFTVDTDGVPTVTTSATVAYDANGATTEGAVKAFSAIEVTNLTKIGVYEYPVTETAGTTTGVTYDSNAYTLRVVVVNSDPNDLSKGVVVAGAYLVKPDGTKTDTIENSYSSQEFKVSKTVKGAMGDIEKYFDVTVTFTAAEGGTLGSAITYTGGKYTTAGTVENGVAEIQVKHGDTVTFANVPDGATWEVVENAPANYTAAYSAATGTISADGENACEITNTCNITPPTGIDLDSVPYIVMLAVAALGVVAFVAKRRSAR